MNGKILLLLIAAAIVVGGGYYLYQQNDPSSEAAVLKTEVEKGNFEILVTASGELQAKRSEKIMGPQGMRAAGIFQTNISDIVSEGTLVAEGSFVASLDRTELADKLKNVTNEIEKAESQLLQTKLDTAIELRTLRDQLINLKYSIEEKKLEAEQNIYEPPAVQRQTQIELEKAERDLTQANKNYLLKREQADARVQEVLATLQQHNDNFQKLTKLSTKFTITAPKAGMVIYERTWNGKKGPGSRITPWDPVVARLPDLSDMISLTYVNEVDISKIRVGQEVSLKVDAFPENSYSGEVISVANIGEQRPNYDAKVFEVKIQILESDSILRPAMTTSNSILTSTLEEVVFIPLETVYSNDSCSYVFLEESKKVLRKEIYTGKSNESHVVVEAGLDQADVVLMNAPSDADNIRLEPLPEEIKEMYEKKKEEEENRRKAQALEQKKKMEEMMKKYGPNSKGKFPPKRN